MASPRALTKGVEYGGVVLCKKPRAQRDGAFATLLRHNLSAVRDGHE